MASPQSVHLHYQTLLRRVGRCLSFGCTPAQRAFAAGLVSCITTAWPTDFFRYAGYLPLRDLRVNATDLTDNDYKPLRNHSAGNRLRVLRNLFTYPCIKKREITFQTVHWAFGVHQPAEMKMPITEDRPFQTWYRLGGHTPNYPAKPFKFTRMPPEFQQGTQPPPVEPLPGEPDERIVIGSVLISPVSLQPVVTVEETLLLSGPLLNQFPGKRKTRTRDWAERFVDMEWVARKIGRETIVPIEEGVRELELETWDREDAVEDMGSAKAEDAKEI